jgi:hypothetical protein
MCVSSVPALHPAYFVGRTRPNVRGDPRPSLLLKMTISHCDLVAYLSPTSIASDRELPLPAGLRVRGDDLHPL